LGTKIRKERKLQPSLPWNGSGHGEGTTDFRKEEEKRKTKSKRTKEPVCGPFLVGIPSPPTAREKKARKEGGVFSQGRFQRDWIWGGNGKKVTKISFFRGRGGRTSYLSTWSSPDEKVRKKSV